MATECESRQDYLDGRLDRPTREAFERHLMHCEVCREEVESSEFLAALLGSAYNVPIPPTFVDRSVQRIQRADRRRRWLSCAAVAAAMLICITLGSIRWSANDADPDPRVVEEAPAVNDEEVASVASSDSSTIDPDRPVRVSVAPEMIAVPVVDRPAFTIMRVYSTEAFKDDSSLLNSPADALFARR